MSEYVNNLILFFYVVTIIYFAMLGAFMVTRQGNLLSTHGEQTAKLRMTRSVGIFMFLWAFDYLLYLVPILNITDISDDSYLICFLVTLMFETPAVFMVMHAIVQKDVNNRYWLSLVALPFVLFIIVFLFIPRHITGNLPIDLACFTNILFILVLLFRYAKEYNRYVQRIKSEYSDISGREIFWAWSCFAGFALQDLVFLLYEYFWEPSLMIFYWLLTIFNAAYLCYCTYRQRPLDTDIVEEIVEEMPEPAVAPLEQPEEKAFYSVVEQKLETLCEDKFLYLEPDLTRETLCRRISVSSTYLKLYFHSRGLSFYQYINTLRVEYAYKLMQENPELSIREICEQSGFRSQTTFRKIFQEVMGCLPSEVQRKKE